MRDCRVAFLSPYLDSSARHRHLNGEAYAAFTPEPGCPAQGLEVLPFPVHRFSSHYERALVPDCWFLIRGLGNRFLRSGSVWAYCRPLYTASTLPGYQTTSRCGSNAMTSPANNYLGTRSSVGRECRPGYQAFIRINWSRRVVAFQEFTSTYTRFKFPFKANDGVWPPLIERSWV